MGCTAWPAVRLQPKLGGTCLKRLARADALADFAAPFGFLLSGDSADKKKFIEQ